MASSPHGPEFQRAWSSAFLAACAPDERETIEALTEWIDRVSESGLPRDDSAFHVYTQILTVDAIDKTVVDAMVANPGWHLLAIGSGLGGQTTLTFGWG